MLAGRTRNSRLCAGRVVVSAADSVLDLTEENVAMVLEEVRPYLVSDGGDCELVEVDGPTVYLKLVGACSSCPRYVLPGRCMIFT